MQIDVIFAWPFSKCNLCILYIHDLHNMGWLLFNANSAIFHLYHLDLYSASSLKQQSAGKHVAPLGHIIRIPSQPLLFLLNAACLTEKQIVPILVFGLTRPRLEPTIYHTRGEHPNHYATNAVDLRDKIFIV